MWLEKSNASIWKVFLCCQTDKSGEIWLQFVSFAGLYVGCYTDSLRIKPVCLHQQTLPWSRDIRPSSQHQSQGKSGLVKNWHAAFCLMDTSHPQPRYSALSARKRPQGHGMKPLGNKVNIWGGPRLYVPRGCANSRGPFSLHGGREPRCSAGSSRGDASPLRKGWAASPTMCEQEEVWQSQPPH